MPYPKTKPGQHTLQYTIHYRVRYFNHGAAYYTIYTVRARTLNCRKLYENMEKTDFRWREHDDICARFSVLLVNKDLLMVDVPVLTVKGIKILLSLGTHLSSWRESQRIRSDLRSGSRATKNLLIYLRLVIKLNQITPGPYEEGRQRS